MKSPSRYRWLVFAFFLCSCYSINPMWLIFNSHDSLRILRKASADFPKELPVCFSNLVTLSRTPDMAPYDDWAHAFEGFNWKNIGASEERYPEDLVSL